METARIKAWFQRRQARGKGSSWLICLHGAGSEDKRGALSAWQRPEKVHAGYEAVINKHVWRREVSTNMCEQLRSGWSKVILESLDTCYNDGEGVVWELNWTGSFLTIPPRGPLDRLCAPEPKFQGSQPKTQLLSSVTLHPGPE